MIPRVWSKRRGAPVWPRDAVYVGRPGQWGNWYRVGAVHPEQPWRKITQADAVDLYTATMFKDGQEWLRRLARSNLRGKDLLCWCAPEPCHANTLLVIANSDNDTQARVMLGLAA